MMMFGILRMWLFALLAVGLWVGVFFLARAWDANVPDPRPTRNSPVVDGEPPPPPLQPPTYTDRWSAWRPGADRATAFLAGGLVLALLCLGGGRVPLRFLLPKGKDAPRHERGSESRRIRRPDGTELHVEFYGPANAPTVVLTHGWGATSTEWYYLRRQLSDRYRLVAWDLPGLGLSTSPRNKDFSLDKLAADLKAVIDETGGGPAVLLGHSIGGMITLNFAKLYPQELGSRVAGLVLVHTTPTNPIRTMPNAAMMTALQKPLLEPLCYLSIAAAPVIWLTNALGYLNGSQHWSNYKQVFSYSATWGQVEFVTRYVLGIWPATYARGVLGMMHYDATSALARIPVPTLVVAADRDKVTKPEASDAIRVAVPGATMVTLSPGGHMGLISKHEEFGGAVLEFLGRCFPRPTASTTERAIPQTRGVPSGS